MPKMSALSGQDGDQNSKEHDKHPPKFTDTSGIYRNPFSKKYGSYVLKLYKKFKTSHQEKQEENNQKDTPQQTQGTCRTP